MCLFRRTVVFDAFVIMPLTAVGETASARPPKVRDVSESVLLQPRSNAFAANFTDGGPVQGRTTTVNLTQESLDASFDKKIENLLWVLMCVLVVP